MVEERYEVTLPALLKLIRWCKVTPWAGVGEMLEYATEEGLLTPVDEREALRVLGAVVYYQAGGYVSLSEGALSDDYTVERGRDVATATEWFKAWPTTRHAP